jgi:hypothetical protein
MKLPICTGHNVVAGNAILKVVGDNPIKSGKQNRQRHFFGWQSVNGVIC